MQALFGRTLWVFSPRPKAPAIVVYGPGVIARSASDAAISSLVVHSALRIPRSTFRGVVLPVGAKRKSRSIGAGSRPGAGIQSSEFVIPAQAGIQCLFGLVFLTSNL